jgi:hypothetical protein
MSIEYLKLWESDQEKWKFRKNLQNHLFKIWDDDTKLPKESWGIFVRYVLAVKGSARQTLLEAAKKRLAGGVCVTENDEERKKASTRRKRAKTLIRALSKKGQ